MTNESELTVTEEVDLESVLQENQKLKKVVGDQGNEIGEQRKQIDQILQQQTAQVEDDWYTDPTEKKVNDLEKQINSMGQEQALRQLETKHPGFRDLPQDESFASWVGNSQYRSNLYAKADQMDMTAADELFTAWEEQQESAGQAHQQAGANRKQALKDAAMEKGSAGGQRKQYYSRSELVDMRIYNRAKWDANYDEIMKAYNEGRVRK